MGGGVGDLISYFIQVCRYEMFSMGENLCVFTVTGDSRTVFFSVQLLCEKLMKTTLVVETKHSPVSWVIVFNY